MPEETPWNPEHLEIVKQGRAKINEWRKANPDLIFRLCGADLSGDDLYGADLSEADLSEANLSGADLCGVGLFGADLSGADLNSADLREANLSGANLSETILNEARCSRTAFPAVNLSHVKGLKTIEHLGPSSIGTDTLEMSKGEIPDEFLSGCGLLPWQIEFARLHDPALTANDISNIVSERLFAKRTDGPLYLGGVFISYSHADSQFVHKIYKCLQEAGAPVWLDQHKLTSGPIVKQVVDAIRIQDVVLLVLSQDSLKSDWVWFEVKRAREREQAEERVILCPVAVDDEWRTYKKKRVEMQQLADEKVILDFSGWKTKKFQNQFDKLLQGMKIHYTAPRD